MKLNKQMITALLCGLVLLAAAGCGKNQEPPAADQQSQAELEEAEVQDTPQEPLYEATHGEVVSLMDHMTDSTMRFVLDGTLEAGTEADLDQWYESIYATNPDNLAFLYVSAKQEEGYSLNAQQIGAIVGSLQALYLDVLENPELGNPAPGGATMIVALDEQEELLWKVNFDSQWFVVQLEGKSVVFSYEPEAEALTGLREALERA